MSLNHPSVSGQAAGASLSDNDFRAIWGKAKGLACARGHSEFAEDFAQEACIAIAAGRKATLDQILTDFLRRYHGDLRTSSGRQRAYASCYAKSIWEREGDDGLALVERIGSPGGLPETRGGNWRARVRLTGRDATLCDLIYDQELSRTESAELLGVTESRVSQMMSRIEKVIQQAMVLDEMLALYHDGAIESCLAVDWIKL